VAGEVEQILHTVRPDVSLSDMQPTDLVHDTIRIARTIKTPVAKIWDAYADTSARSRWGAPAGEAMVYERDDLRRGGSARHRCGAPGELQFRVETEYLVVVPSEMVVHTEATWLDDQLLSTALISWTFTELTDGASVEITAQVVSLVGQDMLDGTRNGHTIALDQLAAMLER